VSPLFLVPNKFVTLGRRKELSGVIRLFVFVFPSPFGEFSYATGENLFSSGFLDRAPGFLLPKKESLLF